MSSNDNNVKIFFKYGDKVIQLPVNPEEFRVSTSGSNATQEVVSLGEVNILKSPKLSEITIESFFPISEAPSYVLTSGDKFKTPQELIDFFQEPYDNKEPIYMVVSGLPAKSIGLTKDTRGANKTGYWKALGSSISNKVKSLMSMGTSTVYDNVPKMSLITKSVSRLVSIEHFETWYQSDFDTNFKLELKQYRNYGAKTYKTILSVDETGTANVLIPSPTRTVNETTSALKKAKTAVRAVKTVVRVAETAKKTVNTIKSTGTFIKTVSKGL